MRSPKCATAPPARRAETRFITMAFLVGGIFLIGSAVSFENARATPAASSTSPEETIMAKRATGTFDVALKPLTTSTPDDSTRGRMSIDKTFHGDLDGTSRGEMLSAMGSVKGSAGYVAIERVTGTLHGRAGSFVLQHHGIMNRGAPSLTVMVVPDSGTEQLAGLAGTLSIEIAEGKHSYVFEYTLPDGP